MAVSREVLQARIPSVEVVQVPDNYGDPNVIQFVLDINCIRHGYCKISKYPQPNGMYELGYCYGFPEGIGIGSKVLQAALRYMNRVPFQSEVVHPESVRL